MAQAFDPVTYRTPDTSGNLKVIGVAVNDVLPAGTIYKQGLAYHPDGSLYVVFG